MSPDEDLIADNYLLHSLPVEIDHHPLGPAMLAGDHTPCPFGFAGDHNGLIAQAGQHVQAAVGAAEAVASLFLMLTAGSTWSASQSTAESPTRML